MTTTPPPIHDDTEAIAAMRAETETPSAYEAEEAEAIRLAVEGVAQELTASLMAQLDDLSDDEHGAIEAALGGLYAHHHDRLAAALLDELHGTIRAAIEVRMADASAELAEGLPSIVGDNRP